MNRIFTTKKARTKMGRAYPKPAAPSGRRQRVKTSVTRNCRWINCSPQVMTCVSPAAPVCTTNDSTSMPVDGAISRPVVAAAIIPAGITVTVATAVVAAAISASINAPDDTSPMPIVRLTGDFVIVNLLLGNLRLEILERLRLDHCSKRCHRKRCRTSDSSKTRQECSSRKITHLCSSTVVAECRVAVGTGRGCGDGARQQDYFGAGVVVPVPRRS